jgi:septal ring factor EnvC (AmiA/AmiB activator)
VHFTPDVTTRAVHHSDAPWSVTAWSLVLFVMGAVATTSGQQGDRAQTEALARRAAERLEALQHEADALATQERTLLGDLRRLELERVMKLEALKHAEQEATTAHDDLEAITSRLAALERQDVSERPDLRARLVELYKLGEGRYVRLLLSTADVRRIGEASRMVSALAALDRQRIASHQRTVAALRATATQAEERSRQLAAARGDAERASQAATRAADARNALVRDIDRRRDLNAQLAGELQAAQAKLQLSLRDIAAGGSAVESVTLPLRPFRGDLAWPADGQVRHRVTRPAVSGGTTSKGIDIAAEEGSPAMAVHEGVVVYADPFTGFGNLVIIDHGSQAFSLYGNLSEMSVKRGSRVERGQTVGFVGESATGQAGLYFELRIDGQPVDPLQWLRKR